MTPQVECELAHLLGQAQAPLWAEYRRGPYDPAKHAILVRMGELHTHMCKVAARSKSPAELYTRLIRDGSIPDEPVIEWYDRDGHYRDGHYRDVSYMLRGNGANVSRKGR